MGNRLAAVEGGRSKVDTLIIERYAERFKALEEEIEADIASAVKDHDMWSWLERVKGIGPGLAGCLLAYVDVEKAQTVSALWRYAGYAVMNGKAEKPTKGQKLGYNADLHKVCYLISVSFLRNKSPYAEVYYEAKEEYQRKKGSRLPAGEEGAADGWTPMHIDLSARRKMLKLFLSHFWEAYREMKGLPVRPVYALAVLNHDGYRGADYFLAPEKVKRSRKKKSAEPNL